MNTKISIRQKEIINVAGKLITEKGVNGLTIKNLASEMHFSESAVYRHFKSREEIILGMLQYVYDHVDENFYSKIENEMSALEKLKLLFKEQFSFFSTHPYLASSIFSEGLHDESEKINLLLKSIMERRSKLIEELICEGQNHKLIIDSINYKQLTHILMGSVKLLMFKWKVANNKFNLENKGQQLIKELIILIKTK